MSRQLEITDVLEKIEDFIDEESIQLDPEITPIRVALTEAEVYELCGAIARKKFRSARSEEIEEHTHNGYIGYLGARDRFDPERGVSFSTFIYRRIYGAMIDAIRKEHGRKGQKVSLGKGLLLDEGDSIETLISMEEDKNSRFYLEDVDSILTRDQSRLLNLFVVGYSQKEISTELGLSGALVSNRLQAIFIVIKGFFNHESEEHRILHDMKRYFSKGFSRKEVSKRSSFPHCVVSEVKASIEIAIKNSKFEPTSKAA